MATTTTTDIKFSCASCGKEYRWKPELAGKQAKCKCGATITVPRTPPPPPVPKQAEVDLDGLYALAAEEKKASARLASDPEAATTQQGYRCPSCGTELPIGTTVCPNCSMDMKTGRKRAAQGMRSNGVAAASAGFATSKRGVFASGCPRLTCANSADGAAVTASATTPTVASAWRRIAFTVKTPPKR